MDRSPPAKAAPEAVGQETRTTSWVLPVVTAVVLIAAFCLYYFVYVKAQREYLGNRNFRSLAALGDQLQKYDHDPREHSGVLCRHVQPQAAWQGTSS